MRVRNHSSNIQILYCTLAASMWRETMMTSQLNLVRYHQWVRWLRRVNLQAELTHMSQSQRVGYQIRRDSITTDFALQTVRQCARLAVCAFFHHPAAVSMNCGWKWTLHTEFWISDCSLWVWFVASVIWHWTFPTAASMSQRQHNIMMTIDKYISCSEYGHAQLSTSPHLTFRLQHSLSVSVHVVVDNSTFSPLHFDCSM